MGVIDPHAMYRAGYAGKRKGKPGKAYLADTIDKMLGFVGKLAISRWEQGMKELGELRKKSRNTRSDINGMML